MFLVFGLRRVWVGRKVERREGGGWMFFEDCERGLLKGVLEGRREGGFRVYVCVCVCMYVCINV